jgi:hypothetical protein
MCHQEGPRKQRGTGIECGTHQLLVSADDVNLSGENINITKKNTESLFVASKKVCLDVDAEKTKYLFMFSLVTRLQYKIIIQG